MFIDGRINIKFSKELKKRNKFLKYNFFYLYSLYDMFEFNILILIIKRLKLKIQIIKNQIIEQKTNVFPNTKIVLKYKIITFSDCNIKFWFKFIIPPTTSL